MQGAGDDDYDEAPDYERDNYWLLGDGLRIPKDQVLGKLIGNPMEMLGHQIATGKVDGVEVLGKAFSEILDSLKPESATPAFINLFQGLRDGGTDYFRNKPITPEYMKNRVGYMQKDLSTSRLAEDLSKFLYDWSPWNKVDIGAKKLQWAIDNTLSNTGRYISKLYDATQNALGNKVNRRMGQNYMDEDSKWTADFMNFSVGNDVADDLLDLVKMAVGKKFIQNQTFHRSIEVFDKEYERL